MSASMGPASSSAFGGPRVWRVLVVDDEENLNWSLVTSLRREFYAADGALTAEDARRRLVDVEYDCIISDIQMPGMDGFQLLSWLREQRPYARVIMMTAFGSPSVRQEAIRHGVAAYLEKPFDLTALKRELRRALETPAQTTMGYDLIETTQVISLSRRDTAIQAQQGDQVGALIFERGELVTATFGFLRGEQAFFALCASPAQAVTSTAIPERFERNINQPVSTLIFDALLKRDAGLANANPGMPTPTAPPLTRSRPSPGPLRASSTSSLAASNGQPQTPPPSMATGSMPLRPPARDPQRTLMTLATAIGRPCAVALVMPDGSIRAQTQTRTPPVPDGAFAQIIQGFISFARAAQLGQWGAPRSAHLTTTGEQAHMRLVGLRPGAPALIVIAPVDIEPRQLEAIIAAHEAELIAMTL